MEMLPDMGRLQPQARELEEAVLGALMLEKDAYSIVSEILKPECFYEKAHEKIYAAIVDLALSQRPVDMLTVTEQLKKRGELEDVADRSISLNLPARWPAAPISSITPVSSPRNIWRGS